MNEAQNTSKRFAGRGLIVWAIILTSLFGIVHILGWRHYTGILSGTGALHPSVMWYGMVYMACYVGLIGIVPILLIASALLYGLNKLS